MIRDIKIHAVLNGYVVEVGCQTVVFNAPGVLCSALNEYLTNPDETEKIWSTLPNAKHTLNGTPVAVQEDPIYRAAQDVAYESRARGLGRNEAATTLPGRVG